MQKWEYLKVDRSLSQEELNELGGQGWELIVIYAGFACYIFKRPAK